MSPFPVPPNEIERQQALRQYGILDTPPEKNFDDLAIIAAHICDAPIAMVSLIDADRQWLKARIGLDVTETPRDVAFCAHTIMQTTIMEVEDATIDQRFARNPLVTESPSIRFYAGVPLIDDNHYSLGSLCVIDQKPRRLSENQKSVLEALGRQVVAMLNLHRSYAELNALAQLKDKFLRIASHDLKNPLQAIMGAASLVQSQLGSGRFSAGDASPMLEMISRRAHGMRRIIEDFLDLQAMEDGQLKLTLDAVDLSRLAREVFDLIIHSATTKRITLRLALEPNLPPVRADRDRVGQVMENLVGNAVKFSRAETVTEVAVCRAGDVVRFEVRDEGPGLTSEDLACLFTQYSRLSNAPTGGEKSSGLGLSISKSLIEAHGGRIGARNNDGCGATFWFELPIAGQ